MSDSLIPSFLVSDLSESLRSLTKNEQIARFFERSAHSLIFSQKNERFFQKTGERIPSPEFSPEVKKTEMVRNKHEVKRNVAPANNLFVVLVSQFKSRVAEPKLFIFGSCSTFVHNFSSSSSYSLILPLNITILIEVDIRFSSSCILQTDCRKYLLLR